MSSGGRIVRDLMPVTAVAALAAVAVAFVVAPSTAGLRAGVRETVSDGVVVAGPGRADTRGDAGVTVRLGPGIAGRLAAAAASAFAASASPDQVLAAVPPRPVGSLVRAAAAGRASAALDDGVVGRPVEPAVDAPAPGVAGPDPVAAPAPVDAVAVLPAPILRPPVDAEVAIARDAGRRSKALRAPKVSRAARGPKTEAAVGTTVIARVPAADAEQDAAHAVAEAEGADQGGDDKAKAHKADKANKANKKVS